MRHNALHNRLLMLIQSSKKVTLACDNNNNIPEPSCTLVGVGGAIAQSEPRPSTLRDSRGSVPARGRVCESSGFAFFSAWNFQAEAIRCTWRRGRGRGRGINRDGVSKCIAQKCGGIIIKHYHYIQSNKYYCILIFWGRFDYTKFINEYTMLLYHWRELILKFQLSNP